MYYTINQYRNEILCNIQCIEVWWWRFTCDTRNDYLSNKLRRICIRYLYKIIVLIIIFLRRRIIRTIHIRTIDTKK